MRRGIIQIFSGIFLLLASGLNAQNPPRLGALESAIMALDRDPDMRSANWGMAVVDIPTNRLLVDHNSQRVLSTASTTKALTTATALATLGPEFRFKTVLAVNGDQTADGVLTGNLFIIGDGDPTLGSDRLGPGLEALIAEWVEAVKATGIRQIRGNVIADGSIFSTQLTPPGWGWEHIGNYYGAGAAGLTINENLYELHLKPGHRTGSPTTVLGTTPEVPGLTFVNELLTGPRGSGDQGYIYGAPYTGIRYLRGTIPAGVSSFTIKGSLPDPGWYTAWRLSAALQQQGIRVDGPPTTQRLLALEGFPPASGRREIYQHLSPTLAEIVEQTNLNSINVYAEALARRVAVKLQIGNGPEDGPQAIESYWQGKGVETAGMRLMDGSGLSPQNAASTGQIAAILAMAKRQRWGTALFNSLPVAGRSGTLKSMLRGTAAEGRLRAKSGYINGVRGYVGYVTTRKGDDLAFALIANNFDCSPGEMRRKLEILLARLAEGQ